MIQADSYICCPPDVAALGGKLGCDKGLESTVGRVDSKPRLK